MIRERLNPWKSVSYLGNYTGGPLRSSRLFSREASLRNPGVPNIGSRDIGRNIFLKKWSMVVDIHS